MTEFRLREFTVLLARPGRTWPVELASHRVPLHRMQAVLHAFRQDRHEIASLRQFWVRHHLGDGRLSDELLLQELSRSILHRRIDALLLPKSTRGVLATPSQGGSASIDLSPIAVSGGTEPAGPAPPDPARKPVVQWNTLEKLVYVAPRVIADVPSEIVDLVRGFFTKEGLELLALIVTLEIAGLATTGPVALAANAMLVGVLWGLAGLSGLYGLVALDQGAKRLYDATSTSELDVAAKDLARGFTLLGTAALSALRGWAKARSIRGQIGGTAARVAPESRFSGDDAGRQTSAMPESRSASTNTPEMTVPAKNIRFEDAQLQAKFKHAGDFGVQGNWNSRAAAAYRNALQAHVDDPSTTVIQGTYRGEPVTHLFNRTTNLNVIRDQQGNFLSGWKLNPQQTRHLLNTGNLGGG